MKSIAAIILIVALTGPSFGDLEDAKRLAGEGAYPEAAAEFSKSAETFFRKKDRHKATAAFLNAAACLKMSGDISAATLLVERAEQVRPPDLAPALERQIFAQKGSVLSLGKVPGRALPFLQRAFRMAREADDLLLLADIENDLGITHGALQENGKALAWFEIAEAHARRGGDGALAIRARQNHLVAAYQLWNTARQTRARSLETGVQLEPIEEALVRSRQGFRRSLNSSLAVIRNSTPTPLTVFHTLTAGLAAQRFGLEGEALNLLRTGLRLAEQTGELRLERAALLALAEAYVARSQGTDALEVLQHARRLTAQPDPSQAAQIEILTAEAHRQAGAPSAQVVAALKRAIQAMGDIRSDLARSQEISDLGQSFRQRTGRPYLLLADEYLRQAERQPGRAQDLYKLARAEIESFKEWELQDFYRDDCVNLTRQSSVDLGVVDDPGVAVLYAIPLDDRVELLLTHEGRIHRRASPLPGPKLASLARRFRYDLESDYGSPAAFFEEAEALYDALIRPLRGVLQDEKVRHLVFVPDGALGTIPLAALFDRDSERYLLEDFSLSIAPSLSLTSGAPVQASRAFGILAGVSQAVRGFPALPEVEQELERVSKLYPQNRLRLNKSFTATSLATDLKETLSTGDQDIRSCVVHIACHGEFRGRATDTFLAAADGPIYLDDLERAIRPRKYRGQPVELLCLSACRTAAGDDRAALGLAGAAVKSGSRSVVASLWYVQSQATSRLMIDFHRNLQGGNTTKAEALRQAQLTFLREDRRAHPNLWAPFILIGNWK